MSFVSPIFLVLFLPLVFLLYFITPKKYKNLLLVFVSLFFYFWNEGLYVLHILFWVIVNYVFSLQISKSVGLVSKFHLVVIVVFNILILGYFKYTNFLFPATSVIYLPLAISFFAFHAIAYNVDVYRRVNKPEKNLLNLMLYFTFFPHLIAGPIIRYHQISKNIKLKNISIENISQGLFRVICGVAKKILIADTFAPIVNEIFALSPYNLSAAELWLGAILFSLQIYYDFSGYSDIAIGLAKVFGFTFPENFNYPYISTSVTEFWKRWHITLSNWFKDYLYIPLGGNRKGALRTYINLFIVFVACGFWHGANWTFLVWGMFHGIILILERIKNGTLVNWMPQFIRRFYTLIFLLTSWVIFRSENLVYAKSYIKNMLTFSTSVTYVYYPISYFLDKDILLALVFGTILAFPLIRQRLSTYKGWHKEIVKTMLFVLLFILFLIAASSETYKTFIYFRF